MSPFASARLSGHESFACRFAWLPKIVAELSRAEDNCQYLFKDENMAMVRLGVGKNMVRSIKFWAEVSGLIVPSKDGGHEVTSFGRNLLGHEGHDQYLERQETLWLIHWKISTGPSSVFYWKEMLNFWHRPEFTAVEVLPMLKRALPLNMRCSDRTLADGVKVFIRAYKR